jgi:hypothetical protein
MAHQETGHARRHRRSGPPPRQDHAGQRIALKQLWHHLPATNRRDALRTLGRIAAQQLPTPPTPKEAGHEPR